MSQILPKSTFKVDARLSTARIPDRLPETYSTVWTKRTDLDASVKVDDQQIRASAPGFDGQERPFVMLPAEHEGKVTWYRHDLQYRGTGVAGPWDTRHLDSYDLPSVTNVDRGALQKYGMALGVDTNVGTLWAQKPGQNFPVRDDDTRPVWR